MVGVPELNVPACHVEGTVGGLDPRGDNFLSVRSGPGGKGYGEIDRLHTGDKVIICEERGPWLAVVYFGQPVRDLSDTCDVIINRPRQPYRGPCRSGWVHSRYVRNIVG